jgi:hypothetical protein
MFCETIFLAWWSGFFAGGFGELWLPNVVFWVVKRGDVVVFWVAGRARF